MAVTHWQLGRASETTATVVVRADSNETVTVAIPGQSVGVSCATATNDGNAVATFTGLQPGTRYAYTINGAAGGSLRTLPSDAPFWLAFSSCWDIQRYDEVAALLRQAPTTGADRTLRADMVAGLAGVFLMGDWLYQDVSATVNGYALSLVNGGSLANAKDVAIRRNYYRAAALTRGRMELIRNVPSYFMKDDHEYDPDNASYSTSWLNDQFAATSPHSAQDLTDVWTAATTAWRDWNQGNPPREVTGPILSGPDCYRVRIGPVELWVTDMIQERDYTGTVDSSTKRIISAAQEEWLLSTMAASTARFKVWVSTKQFISSCGRNSDGFTDLGGTGRGYRTQLRRILNDSRFPRAGALSVTGDEHIASDMWCDTTTLGGAVTSISQISAGPATIDVITDPNDGLTYRAGVVEKERDISNATRRGENNYVLLRVLADRVERYTLSQRFGLRFKGYVGTADNVVRR